MSGALLAKKPKEQPGYVSLSALLGRLRRAIGNAQQCLNNGEVEPAKDWLIHAGDILHGKATW